MKFIVNARFLTQPITGVQRFAIEISQILKNKFQENILFVAPKEIIHHEIAEKLEVKLIGSNKSHMWEQFDLPRFLRNNNSPVLLNLCNTAPLFYHNNIITIHDIAFEVYPHTFSKKFLYVYKYLIPRLANSAKKIITVSEFSKSEMIKYYKLPSDKITVIYNATGESFFAVNDENYKKEKYFLAVSSLNARKNLFLIMDAFERFQKSHDGYKLLIIGDTQERSFSSIKLDHYKQNKDIIFVGRVSDDELRKFYTNAVAFIYPSLYEGFGIPPLEAQKCETPVIVSDIPCFREVFKDSVLYCNAHDINSLMNRMIEILDPGLCQKMSDLGIHHSQNYNWNKSAEKLMQILPS